MALLLVSSVDWLREYEYGRACAYSWPDMKKGRVPRTWGIWLPAEGWGFNGIQISKLSDDHSELVVLGDVMAPRSFTAHVDRDDLPLVELDIEFLEERFRCVQLRVLRRDGSDFVEAQQLRHIRLVDLVREAVGLVAYLVFELCDEEDVEKTSNAFQRLADLDATPIKVDDIRVGDFFRVPALLPLLDQDNEGYRALNFLASQLLADGERLSRKGTATNEEVAQIYRQALGKRQPVTDAVAVAFGWQRQTARNRIYAARRAGFLPETAPGSARAWTSENSGGRPLLGGSR
jgi:hypothetical protein